LKVIAAPTTRITAREINEVKTIFSSPDALRAGSALASQAQSSRFHNLAEVRDLLAPLYSGFTEGFDTIDLKDAKALLKELDR
jgi:hypothetical protein